MTNAFTVDLEDWFHGVGIPISEWHRYENRLMKGYEPLMKLLSKYNVKATFFILGKVIEDYPNIINELITEGHEIGCHTYSHTELFYSNKETFESEIQKCIELIKPYGITYSGFRAPYFSIDHRTMWALDVLKKYNFKYDTSIFPGDSKRTGIEGYRKDIHHLSPYDLMEIPISTFKIFSMDFGLGGAYFRILPYKLFSRKIKEINKTRPAIFYIHPWELDVKHPYLSFLSQRRKIPHYWNLGSTEKKIELLLQDFQFGLVKDIIKQ